MIYKQKSYNKPIKDDQRTYDTNKKITTGQGVDNTNYSLDYTYFKNHYKLIAINLSKQQALHADPMIRKQYKKSILQ